MMKKQHFWIFASFIFIFVTLPAFAQVPDEVPIQPTEVSDPVEAGVQRFEIIETKEVSVFKGTQEQLDLRISNLHKQIDVLEDQLNALTHGSKKPL